MKLVAILYARTIIVPTFVERAKLQENRKEYVIIKFISEVQSRWS